MNPIVGFGLARIAERKRTSDAALETQSSTNSRDFLSRFLEAQAKDESIPPWYQLPSPCILPNLQETELPCTQTQG